MPDPDLGVGIEGQKSLYDGESSSVGRQRSWQTWLGVAEVLGARLMTPRPCPDAAGWVELRLQALAHTPAPDAEGYDPKGEWGRVNKLEDPFFVQSIQEAWQRVQPPAGGRILCLGVGAGQELQTLALAFPAQHFDIVGIDLCGAALEMARQRFSEDAFLRASFVQADVNDLPADLGQFDAVLMLSLLQSPAVKTDVLISRLRREHLKPTAGLIAGFPNARYRDGLLSYGARLKNFARPDLSLLMQDVVNLRKQLHRFGYKTFVTGKYEVLLTAIPASSKTPRYDLTT